MDRKKIKNAIIEWKHTGKLVDDKELVLEILDVYKTIKENCGCVPEYELMFKDACSEHSRLCDIIKARGYSENNTYSV